MTGACETTLPIPSRRCSANGRSLACCGIDVFWPWCLLLPVGKPRRLMCSWIDAEYTKISDTPPGSAWWEQNRTLFVCDQCFSPTVLGFAHPHQVTKAIAHIFHVVACWHKPSHFADRWLLYFVEADNEIGKIIRFFVEIEQVLPRSDKIYFTSEMHGVG